jgi:Ras-related C3 botulinum toxin substrate 1
MKLTFSVVVNNESLVVNVSDVLMQDEYEQITAILFENRDAFILCFSLGNRQSFENISKKWNDGPYKTVDFPPHVIWDPRHYSPNAPLILVGCKSDAKRVVTEDEGKEAAKVLNATYFECSAVNGRNVKAIFEEAVRAVLESEASKSKKKKKKCNIQ